MGAPKLRAVTAAACAAVCLAVLTGCPRERFVDPRVVPTTAHDTRPAATPLADAVVEAPGPAESAQPDDETVTDVVEAPADIIVIEASDPLDEPVDVDAPPIAVAAAYDPDSTAPVPAAPDDVSTGNDSGLDADPSALLSAVTACTAEHGYEPLAPQPTAGLGVGELAWRTCVHTAADRIMSRSLRRPELLVQLLRADGQLTDAILTGGVTREQRTADIQRRLTALAQQERNIRLREADDVSDLQVVAASRLRQQIDQIENDINILLQVL